MSEINFLDNQRHDDDGEKPKGQGDKKQKLAWSNPKKEAKGPKSSLFSFLPFINKPAPVNQGLVSSIDKNKLKQSRKEILNLIKRHESSKPRPKEKGKNFLRALGEKLKKQPALKEVLADYQRIFNQKKEPKSQIGRVFNIKPAIAGRPALKAIKPSPLIPSLKGERAVLSWFSRLIKKLFKNKIIALNIRKNETAKIIKLPKAEEIKAAPIRPIIRPAEKPAEIKEIKIVEPKPIHKNEIRQRVLETNLIQGELTAFFDWRAKAIILAGAILAPIFVVGAVYYGLVFYQKNSQAENLAQAKKLAELEQNIIKEEADVKEIFAFQDRLKTVSQVFKQHIYWTNFFKFLEDGTIKDVYFVNFNGDTGGDYVMDALAANYGNIAEQINVFRDNEKITAVLNNGGDLAAGGLVKFLLNFSVSKSIFTE